VIEHRTSTPAGGLRRRDFLRRTAVAGAGVAGAGAALGGVPAVAGGTRPGRRETTLRDRINRVAYVVINVTDLERSRAFYESVTPLKVAARTQAPVQRFAGLGIGSGQFDGYLMDDGTGGPPTQIHLVEWTTPEPVGQSYPYFWHVGLAKIAFTTPSAKSKLAQLRQLGITPTNRLIYRGYTTIQDPDGVIVSFPGSHTAELPAGEDPRRYEKLLHTNPSVREIARSMRFYGELLGLDLAIESVPCEPIASSQGPGSDLVQWDSHLYTARGDGRFKIDASQFHYPPPTKESIVPYAEPNHVGIARVGLEVDDIDACDAILRKAQSIGKAPGLAGPPEEWDYGSPVGVRRVLSFRDPDGIRLELTEKVPVRPVTTCTQPVNPRPIPV
jgi:catechol 2,3-dioxygenase-like lactoylglutathione lyase family enzyme